MGYELTSAITFNKFVQLVRQSTVAELKQIEQRVLQAVSMVEGKDERQSELVEHAKTLFLDALATAATRNSLHELVHKIKNRELSSPKAAQLIKIFVANQHR
jgi:2-methylcitrate dehydratase PrpD